MKVIKENKIIDSFKLQIVCEKVVDEYGFSYGNEYDFCGSKLEINEDDIEFRKWYKFPDYYGADYGVVCPVCGNFIPIDKNIIPESVKKDAEENRCRG